MNHSENESARNSLWDRSEKDDEDGFNMVKRQKTNFTINQEEEQQRHMKDAEDEENKNSLAIFNWFRSDKGIPYEWAKDNLTDSNLEQMAAADSNERAVEEARQ